MEILSASPSAAPLRSVTVTVAVAASGVTARNVLLSIVTALGIQNLLLLAFLGQPWIAVAVAGIGLAVLILSLRHVLAVHGAMEGLLAYRLLAGCFAIALIVYLLGGEGRFFYANTDWQVRGPVLHDLVRYAWPFAYAGPQGGLILRAPMGMYLAPAAIAKLTGEGSADILLLVQDALLLTGVLALGCTLFAPGRARATALFVFLGFSGMDCIGIWLTGRRLDVHLEQWTMLQYSAHLTQAFWVPQHSLAGWIGALLYLLWQQKRIPLVIFASASPLLALLSPLAMIGLVPFMFHAGLDTLLRRRLRPLDIALPALALALAAPALLYMATGSGAVGGKVGAPSLLAYVLSVTLEVGLPLTALFLHGGAHRYGRIASLLVLGILLTAPFGHIGQAVDFVMRASIPALAILALLVAQMLIEPAVTGRQRFAVGLATMALVIGLATPVTETLRAIRFPASPLVQCNYAQVVPGGAATYVAPVRALPAPIRPDEVHLIAAPAKTDCWDGRWPAGETTGLFDRIRAVPARTYVPGQPEIGQSARKS